jgi:hypothetical protein
MGKKRIHESSAASEERADAGQIEHHDCAGGANVPPAQETAQPLPQSHRELGKAILSSTDPVKVGRELLDKNDDRGAATRLRSLETFADWTFGKPGPEGQRKPPRIIWDIPGPPYESPDPEQEKAERGEK